MLFRSSAVACALVVSFVQGTYVAPQPSVSPIPDYASPAPLASSDPSSFAPNTDVYISAKAQVVVNLQTTESSIVKYGPIFQDAFKRKQVKNVISGLVDIRLSILTLTAHVNVGLGIWLGVDLNVFANLYVSLLAKLQVLLLIIRTNGQLDACRSSIIALSVPLKALISVWVNAGINVSALIAAKVDLNVFASVGLSLGVAANVGLGVGVGAAVGVGAKVNAGY